MAAHVPTQNQNNPDSTGHRKIEMKKIFEKGVLEVLIEDNL